MGLKDIPEFAQPREKLAHYGPEHLKDHELLAILLRTGYKGKNVLEVAKRILDKYPLEKLLTLPLNNISNLKGIGPSRASTLVAAYEVCKRAQQTDPLVTISSAQDVYKVTSSIWHNKREHLVVLLLNARNQLVKSHTVSIGTLTSNLVHPREVFAPAFEERAAQIIIVHNHPSGDPTPSFEDIQITERLLTAGGLLGIELVDHVIVSSKNYCSIREQNLVKFT